MSTTAPMQQDDEPEILVEVTNGVGWVTLNRPARRNPITEHWPRLLNAALDRCESDPACRAVIITGKGPAFCGGADLKGFLGAGNIDPEAQYHVVRDAFRVVRRIRELELPVIAAVNGVAVGGGAALGLAADIAIACPEASYYFAFGRVGASGADMGCTYFLPRYVGAHRAAYLMLTGATVDAEQGRELGLFIDIFPADELLSAAEDIANRIAEAYPRRAAAMTKMSLKRGETTDMAACIDYEAIAQNYAFRLEDHKQRLGQFLKRWD